MIVFNVDRLRRYDTDRQTKRLSLVGLFVKNMQFASKWKRERERVEDGM